METVTILRLEKPLRDDDGDLPDTVPARIPFVAKGIAPRTSAESAERGREGVVIGLTVYAPRDAAVLSTDQLEVRGEVYDVDGDPGVWRSPFTGVLYGSVVQTIRAVG